ncbi:MAG: hypothetical protein WKG01_11445 [Kofleriaceae bacterium]
MSNPSPDTPSWTELYIALRQRAEAVRGFIELDSDTPPPPRWPRTTGADVLAIVATIDPFVRRLRPSDQALGLQRRWRACVGDVGRFALTALGETYPRSRELWACLALVFVHLSSLGASLPDPAIWSILLDELGDVLLMRNVGPKTDGPFKQFDNIKTFHDLYLAQFVHLRATRGVDRMKPEPGMTGVETTIPRSTNHEVVQLADYWTKQLDAVKHVTGHAEAVRRWKSALVDVDQTARRGDPNALYSKNNGFWRALSHVARQVSAADETQSTWDIYLESFKDAVKNLPENIAAGASQVASSVASAAGDVAQGVGKVANEAGKGLFSGFGTPLLVGGGLLGLFLLSRSRDSHPGGG